MSATDLRSIFRFSWEDNGELISQLDDSSQLNDNSPLARSIGRRLVKWTRRGRFRPAGQSLRRNISVTAWWEVAVANHSSAEMVLHLKQMQNAPSVIVRTVKRRAGWSRIGVAISLLIVAIASVTLYRLLRGIEFEKVLAALQATSLRTVLIAFGFVVTGYMTLTFYDFFSLRAIGRHEVPYRIAALASFTSYAIGHNLGATVITGGAVRFRIYSAWGLSIIEVAKIAFVTGLTFWLGNAFVLGVGMAYVPEAAGAVDQLPAWLNRTIAMTGLAAIVGYLIWLLPRPRVIGRNNWQITLPDASLTLVQIGIGILDLGSGALVIYTLLPSQPPIDFTTVLVTFVVAALLGFVSHVPGSLGVFDAAVIVALPQFEKEKLLASLLIFRVLYFVLPFFLATLVLGIRELWLGVKATTAPRDCKRCEPP